MAVHVESESDIPEPGPLCDEPEFAELIAGMVSDAAPRVFALVAERGERVDAAVFAWGVSLEDHAVLIGPGNSHGRFRSAESAHRLHSRVVKLRLVWVS